jgi:mannose-6-phosphate isomerase-like protein (cupin superfamily)
MNQYDRGGGVFQAGEHDLHHFATRWDEQVMPPLAMQSDEALDGLTDKPWGHEYRLYADAFYDLWHLEIAPGQQTSMHCHPRKCTALLTLSGSGAVHLFEHPVRTIGPVDVLHLGRGVFHQTRNVGTEPLHLIEVEVPRNKHDLVRLHDVYGRAGQGYESPPGMPLTKLCSLARHPHRPGARLRSHCLHQHYHFAILRGEQVARQPEPGHLLSVCLALHLALAQRIQVFAATDPVLEELWQEPFVTIRVSAHALLNV